MIPLWIAMLIPHWMISVQGVFTYTIHEATSALDNKSLQMLSIALLGGLSVASTIWEATVLKNKKYVASPFTTGLYWSGRNEWFSAISNTVISTALAVINPVDIGSLIISERMFYSNLIARGLVSFGVLGGLNLIINQGFTEQIGSGVNTLINKIRKTK